LTHSARADAVDDDGERVSSSLLFAGGFPEAEWLEACVGFVAELPAACSERARVF